METVTVKEVRIAEKELLTLEEASHVFGIGINKLREISDPTDCDFVLYVVECVKKSETRMLIPSYA